MPPQEPKPINAEPTSPADTTPSVTPPPDSAPTTFSPSQSAPITPAVSTDTVTTPSEAVAPEVAAPTASFTPESASEPASETVQGLGEAVVSPTVSAPTPPSEPTPQVIASTAAGSFTPTSPVQPIQPVTSVPLPTASAYSQPIQPMVVSGSDSSAPTQSSITPNMSLNGGKKKRKLFIVATVALVVLLGGGYVFGIYLPNTPSNVYSAGLDRSARVYDKLVAYSKDFQTKQYKSSKVTGDFKFVSATAAGDGNFNFSGDQKNLDGTLNVNVAGIKASLNARAVTASGQTTPDVYFQVNGVKTILDGYGLSQFSSLDGQWISVDHTLLETVAAGAAGNNKASDLKAPTSGQVQDALARVGQVNRQYLFKADANHAVLKKEKYLGKSVVNGRSVYGYQVGYDKANLKSYIKGLQTAVNDSSLNTWIKSVSGKPASEADLNSILTEVDKADSNYSFTMYVDAKTKLIDVLHFKDPKSNTYFEIGQSYSGGNVMPFNLKVVSSDDPKNSTAMTLSAAVDTKANKITINENIDAQSEGSPISVKFNADVTFNNDAVNVTAPAGAKPIMEIYQAFAAQALGGASAAAGSSSSAAALQGFSLTQ